MLPLYIDLTGKKVVVFGGGEVAERKIRQIFETAADAETERGKLNVEVYSLDFTAWIKERCKKEKCKKEKCKKEKSEVRCFRCNLWDSCRNLNLGGLGGLVRGAFLVIICTDDEALNEHLFKEVKKASKFGVLVNYKQQGDAFMSAVVKKGRGGFLISVSTGGKSPAMARHLKEKISSLVLAGESDGESDGESESEREEKEREEKMLLVQSHLRQRLKETVKDEKKRQAILNRVLSEPECWAALDTDAEPFDFEAVERKILGIVGRWEEKNE